MPKNEEKTCFVIAPIGQEGSETRKRSDQILGHVIRPGAEECGYKAIRADEISAPGLITDQIINHVLDDPMLVADLTDWNPNVFYELAIRHAFRKPFVLLFQPVDQKDQIPFDVAGLRAVILDYPDWDSMVDSKAKLIEAIKAAEAMDEKQLVTPITRAIDIQALTESKDPTAAVLAELDRSVKLLEQRMISMDRRATAVTPITTFYNAEGLQTLKYSGPTGIKYGTASAAFQRFLEESQQEPKPEDLFNDKKEQ